MHLYHLLKQAFLDLPSLVSSNWLAIGMSVALFGLTVLVNAFVKGWNYVKRDWEENTLIGLSVVAVGWFCLYCGSVVHTVYLDHQNMATRWQAVVREKDNVKKELKSRDDYIMRLEARKCPDCARSKTTRPVSVPTISALTLQARAVCTLRNPSSMPRGQDTLPTVNWLSNDKTSYIEGPRGKFYFQSNPSVPYRRAEEEGQVYATQTFTLPPESNLIGQPISWLTEFASLHVELWSITGNNFATCTHAEFAMMMNGVQIYSKIINQHISVPSNYLVADIPIAKGETKF
jgi:hypothetical protein